MSREAWTPSRLLLTWGLIHAAGRLQDVIRKLPTGEDQAEDDEMLAHDYVCRTQGYFKALPVLRFVYAYHGDPRHFSPTMPGETLQGALKRLEWHKLEGLPLKVIGPTILEEFEKHLVERCLREPLVYHKPVEETVLPLRTQFA